MKRNPMLVALMDEYTKAVRELQQVLLPIQNEDFILVRDENTKDPDCKSIQSVVKHTVEAGYQYASYFDPTLPIQLEELPTSQSALHFLDKILDETHHALTNWYEKSQDEIDLITFDVSWGVTYTIEQLLEHAIVHILRHRRQVEHFLKAKN